jgi:ABC-type microcin C transport system duplicated ATPase subunit YejF
MLLMTHDVNVVAKFSDYVAVMYAGRIMEYGPTREVFSAPKHPYTQGLLAALGVFTLCLTEPGTDGFVITAVTLAVNVRIGVPSDIYLYKNRDHT